MATRPIDEKLVVMKMDNSDLKHKAAETTGIFGKLQAGLNKIPGVNLGKTANELGKINSAARSVDMNGLSRAIDTVNSRFSNMGVVATTALVNITNQAVVAGQQMIKSFTSDPIKQGFQEYETKMKSIQTILANTQSKGTTLKDVKASLAELNTYADKTIYSFADMTKNIGFFTNAGLGLKESTSMIKGFSNAAAASGAGAEEAAHAAYQLSQGLMSGYIITQDWMSLTNAGMGNDNMRRDLINLGHAMGTLEKHWTTKDALEDWKNLLTDKKWLTTDVMATYLQAMAGDLTQAQLQAKGLSAEQAKILLNNAKVGNEAATMVRTFTGLFGALKEGIGSGWATTWELIIGDFEVATKRLTKLSGVLNGFFDKQANARNKFVKSLADNGVFDTMWTGVTAGLKGVGAVLGVFIDAFSKVFSPPNIDSIFKMAKGFENFVKSLMPSKQTLQDIGTIFQAVFSTIKAGITIIVGLAKALWNMIPPGLVPGIISIGAYIGKMVISFTDAINKGDDLSTSTSGLGGIFKFLGNVVDGVVDGFGKLGGALSKVGKAISENDTFQSVTTALSEMQFSFDPIINAFKKFFQILGDGFSWVKEKIGDFKDALADMMPSGDKLLAGGFIAGLAAITGGSFKIIYDLFQSFTGWGKIGNGVSELLEETAGAMQGFARAMTANAIATTVISVSIAVGILAVALKLLSTIDPKTVSTALTALVTSLTGLIGAMYIMSKYDITGTGLKAAVQLVALSVAFAIMAGALKKMSDMKWSEITKGLYGLAGTMAVFTGAVVLMSRFGKKQLAGTALQMLALAGAMHILVSVVDELGKMNPDAVREGLKAMGIMMLEIGIFMRLAGGSKFGIGSTLGMLAIGKAIKNIVSAIDEISKIDSNNLKTGLKTIALILLEISLFALATSKLGLFSAGAGMLFISAALLALTVPIGILGNMKWDTLGKGLFAIGTALATIAMASIFSTGMVGMGIGLLAVAAGMTALLIPISAFAAMGWGPMLIGISGLAIALGAIGLAGAILTPVIPSIFALGVATLALGAGMALGGVGLSLFSAGLLTLATMSAGAVTSIVAVLGTLLVGMASLIPSAVDFIVKLTVQLASAIAKNAPIIATKLSELVLGLLDVLTKYVPQFVTKGTDFIIALIKGLQDNVPKLIEAGINFMIDMVQGMANGIREHGPELTGAFLDLFGAILFVVVDAGIQVINALFGWIPGVKSATASIGNEAEKAIRDSFGAGSAGKDKGTEFANAVGSKSGDARTAGSKVGKSAKDGANGTDMKSPGSKIGLDFANAVASKTGAASASGRSLANSGKTGAGSVSMNSTGFNFGSGFASGISGAYDKVVSAGKSLAKKAKDAVTGWLDIHSPSRVMRKDGGWFGEGFALGILDKSKSVRDNAINLAMTAKDSLNKFIDGFQLPEGDNELRFKAVVDYDKVDPRRFGNISPMSIRPDTSYANQLISATKAGMSQNGYSSTKINTNKSSDNKKATNDSDRPLIIQSVLDGRVLSEQIVPRITELQNRNQTMIDRARGAY